MDSTLDPESQPVASLVPQRPQDILEDQGHDYVHGRLTHRQLFYILVPQGLGAAVIDAVCNFALASAMYRTTRKEIRLWPLEKNTIAGDMGVTVIIQGILTTLTAGALVRNDVYAKRIEPFSFPWPHVAWWQHPSRKASWWKWFIGAVFSFLSPTHSLSLRHGLSNFIKSFCFIVAQGFLISALYFPVFWPLAIAITAPLFGGVDMHGTWTPEIIKAVFGGTLGLFMNPFVAALVLGFHAADEESTYELTDPETFPAHVRSISVAGHSKSRRKISSTSLSHARIASTTTIANPPIISASDARGEEEVGLM